MKNLVVLVGPPGVGKSTLAKEVYDGHVYVNQDSQREDHLDLFNAAVGMEYEIVIDRMNFNKQQRLRYLKPAKEAGYHTTIVVLHQPKQVCLDRCNARVGHETIKDSRSASKAVNFFFQKYERPTKDEADDVVFVWPDGEKPSACIFDLDGTMCNVDHRLHFIRKSPGEKKDWKSFFDNIPGDVPNKWCVDICHSFSKNGHVIVYCSGRPEDRKTPTVNWLEDNCLNRLNETNGNGKFELFMRPRNDSRDDSVIKEIILDFEILTRFTPYIFIDDRSRVSDMWRRRGFVCLQCAKGDF